MLAGTGGKVFKRLIVGDGLLTVLIARFLLGIRKSFFKINKARLGCFAASSDFTLITSSSNCSAFHGNAFKWLNSRERQRRRSPDLPLSRASAVCEASRSQIPRLR